MDLRCLRDSPLWLVCSPQGRKWNEPKGSRKAEEEDGLRREFFINAVGASREIINKGAIGSDLPF